MNKNEHINMFRLRLLVFAAAVLLHIVVILFAAFRMETASTQEEPLAGVMKLMDLQEEAPPPPPEKPPELPQLSQEAVAETIIETDEIPPPVQAAESVLLPEQIDYLPQHKISAVPVLPEDQIRQATVYPPIARRSGIEGSVFLELFIDHQGNVRQVRILRETPEGRGFGEAAVNAFRGIRGKPAESNGVPVAVRYRYNITFTLK
jgi:protein TonB